MAQFVDANTKTFNASAAIAQHARVMIDSNGDVAEAGLTDKDIGTALQEAFASGDKIAVRLRTASGTVKVIANEACAIAALLYTETSGRVQDTAQATAFQFGHALEAAAAAGDIIEAIRLVGGDTAAV